LRPANQTDAHRGLNLAGISQGTADRITSAGTVDGRFLPDRGSQRNATGADQNAGGKRRKSGTRQTRHRENLGRWQSQVKRRALARVIRPRHGPTRSNRRTDDVIGIRHPALRSARIVIIVAARVWKYTPGSAEVLGLSNTSPAWYRTKPIAWGNTALFSTGGMEGATEE